MTDENRNESLDDNFDNTAENMNAEVEASEIEDTDPQAEERRDNYENDAEYTNISDTKNGEDALSKDTSVYEESRADYTSEYKMRENGQYSYVYLPKNGEKKEKKNGVRYAIIAICSVIVACLLFGTAFMVGMSIGVIKNFGGDEDVTDDADADGLDFGDGEDGDDEVSIVSPSQKVDIDISQSPALDEDGVTSAGVAYSSFTEVYYAVSASVVEISTEKITNSNWMGQYITTGAGSGVIIDGSGYIVTNNHVIEGASNVTVRLNNGKEYSASLVGTDDESDIAVIKIDPKDEELCVAKIGNSSDLVVCEDILVIGNPLGSLGGSATVGKISTTDRYISVDGENMVLLQTDAAINPGNSGGGMFNLAGQLVGIVNAKASGDDIEGLGFAIPVNTAYSVMTELIEYGYVRGRVDCGLTLYDVTSAQVAMYYFRSSDTGVYIWESEYTDDFEYGDRIISIGGTGVRYSDDVLSVLDGYSVGDEVEFVVKRDGKTVTVKFTLREYIPDYVDFDEE